uniref:Uncharacterized protein n=1 Tax=Anguilla anguilla TaxID=7936 RepID=A0A0E9PLH3_ANGAN
MGRYYLWAGSICDDVMRQKKKKGRRRRRRKCKIPLIWSFIVWTCEVVCELCLFNVVRRYRN